jgi:hypothetical protein
MVWIMFWYKWMSIHMVMVIRLVQGSAWMMVDRHDGDDDDDDNDMVGLGR